MGGWPKEQDHRYNIRIRDAGGNIESVSLTGGIDDISNVMIEFREKLTKSVLDYDYSMSDIARAIRANLATRPILISNEDDGHYNPGTIT